MCPLRKARHIRSRCIAGRATLNDRIKNPDALDEKKWHPDRLLKQPALCPRHGASP